MIREDCANRFERFDVLSISVVVRIGVREGEVVQSVPGGDADEEETPVVKDIDIGLMLKEVKDMSVMQVLTQ